MWQERQGRTTGELGEGERGCRVRDSGMAGGESVEGGKRGKEGRVRAGREREEGKDGKEREGGKVGDLGSERREW